MEFSDFILASGVCVCSFMGILVHVCCATCMLSGAEIKKELGAVTTIIADLPPDDELREKLEMRQEKLKKYFERLLGH